LTAAFDCPKCGAPLSFEPHPGDETVECPYCHETVIIPEELRIPLPRVVVDQQPPAKRSKRLIWAIMAFVGIIVVAVCVAIIIIGNPSNQSTANLPTDTASFDSGSATATVEAKATLDALQPILQMEQSWPASFTETFTDNNHQWQTGDVRDSYITGNRSISSGTYTWNITTVQSTSDFSFPNMPDQQDFYASVDMKLVSMPDDPDADAGMVFRDNTTDQTWYYFSANDLGQYYFGWFNGTDWYTLIPETDSAAIHPGQTNRLTVGVQGSQFIFLINGQMVDHFIDDNLKSGKIGLGINLPQTGEKATVEFSNFTVLSSPPNP
jgi:DNA-directed RNA polymerase subunit RPC12/RpoP